MDDGDASLLRPRRTILRRVQPPGNQASSQETGDCCAYYWRTFGEICCQEEERRGWIIFNEEEAIQKILQRFNDVTRKLKKQAAEREAADEEEARIAAEEEIDVEALLKSPINGVLDAQLSPPNNMAEATIDVNDAAASRADHLFSPHSVITCTLLPYERLSAPMASLLAPPNLDSLAQGHEWAPTLRGSTLPPTSTIGNSFAQGHKSTPNPTGDVPSLLPFGSSSATDDDPMNGILFLPFPELTDPATSLDGLDQHAPHPEDQDKLSMELDDI